MSHLTELNHQQIATHFIMRQRPLWSFSGPSASSADSICRSERACSVTSIAAGVPRQIREFLQLAVHPVYRTADSPSQAFPASRMAARTSLRLS